MMPGGPNTIAGKRTSASPTTPPRPVGSGHAPLRGLLEIMAEGQTSEGWTLGSPEFREQFTRESVLASDWYAARLDVKQAADVAHQQLGLDRLREFSAAPENEQVSQRLHLQDRIADAETDLAALIEAGYRESLVGTIGRQEKFD